MKRQKLKQTSFLGAALAMSVSGIEMPAHAAEMPTPGKGISMGEVIGVGGQAVVRTATQNDLKRTVAVKAVHHPTDAVISALLFRARSVADFNWPQAAMMSSPLGVRIGLA